MMFLLTLLMRPFMGINEDIATMEEVCQRMQRMLVRLNPTAYYIDDDGRLMKRHPDGRIEPFLADRAPMQTHTHAGE